jgi:hypothetical protein
LSPETERRWLTHSASQPAARGLRTSAGRAASPLVTLSIDFLEGIIVLDLGTDDEEGKNSVSAGLGVDLAASIGGRSNACARGYACHSHLPRHDPSWRHRPVGSGASDAATFGPRRRRMDTAHVSAYRSAASNILSARCTCRTTSRRSAS